MRVRRLADAWSSFWFDPISTAPLAVFRIAFGFITLAWALSLLPELSDFFTKTGILPDQPQYTGSEWGAWGLLGITSGKTAVIVLAAALIISSVCLIIGLVPQLAAAVVFLALMSYERRNPFVFNAGDWLLRILAFYLIFAPTGAALSLARFWRDRSSFWTFPARAPWAMRLIQVQFSIVYFVAVWTKVQGTTWNNGTAVSYALRIKDIERFPVPFFVTNSVLISNVLSYGTLVLELALAILVWNRRLRPWILLAGLSLHVGIEYSIRVGFYGFAIVSMYLLWISPARIEDLVLALRNRASGGRLRGSRRLQSEPG